MVELLLRGNASPFQENNNGDTAYTLARDAGRPLIMNMIAEARVLHAIDMENAELALSAVRDGGYVNLRNGAGWTPLMLATAQNRVDVVNELLQHGADCNRSENDGWTVRKSTFNGHYKSSDNFLMVNAGPSFRCIR